MTASDHAIMTEGLKAEGVLGDGEMLPNQSIPLIRKHLKQLEKAAAKKKAAGQ